MADTSFLLIDVLSLGESVLGHTRAAHRWERIGCRSASHREFDMAQMHVSRPGGGRVPAEHRLLGMDRRTFPYAIVALAVWIFWAVVVPGINSAVPWDDPIRPGDTLQVTSDVTVTPAVGWGLRSGLRTSDRTASGVTSDDVVLGSDGVQFQITAGPWTGTPAELLQQITTITTTVAGGQSLQITGGVNTVETTSGDTGVLETFSSPRTQGVIAAFVFDSQGLQVQAVGPPTQVAAHARDIENMITSIHHDRTSG